MMVCENNSRGGQSLGKQNLPMGADLVPRGEGGAMALSLITRTNNTAAVSETELV